MVFMDDTWEANDLLQRTVRKSKSTVQKLTIVPEIRTPHNVGRNPARGGARGPGDGNRRQGDNEAFRGRGGQSNFQRGRATGGMQRKFKYPCNFCNKDNHSIFHCNEIDKATANDVQSRGLCVKCLYRNHEGECDERSTSFCCPQHNQHRKLCKCAKPIAIQARENEARGHDSTQRKSISNQLLLTQRK